MLAVPDGDIQQLDGYLKFRIVAAVDSQEIRLENDVPMFASGCASDFCRPFISD